MLPGSELLSSFATVIAERTLERIPSSAALLIDDPQEWPHLRIGPSPLAQEAYLHSGHPFLFAFATIDKHYRFNVNLRAKPASELLKLSRRVGGLLQ